MYFGIYIACLIMIYKYYKTIARPVLAVLFHASVMFENIQIKYLYVLDYGPLRGATCPPSDTGRGIKMIKYLLVLI